MLDVKRREIINAAVPFVLETGWSEVALYNASLALGQDSQYWGLFFSDISSAVEFFEQMEDARMLNVMVSIGPVEGIRNKIGKALFERIVNISGGAMMLMRLKEFYAGIHAPDAARNIWRSADVIWCFAGDKATDFNYYSKRALLSGVYIAVVKNFLSSSDSSELPQYIADSLDKVVEFGKFLKIPKMEDVPILRMFC